MISAIIITKDEELNIHRCLSSLSEIDEVIIVDSGSTDATLKIARSFNCKIIETDWLGYGATRNIGIDQSKNEWILVIDADEELSEPLKKKISSLMLPVSESTVFSIKRDTFYLGKLIRFSGWQDDRPNRLFNKNHCRYNLAPVHESIHCTALTKYVTINEPILHYSYPSLTDHIKKINLYSSLASKEVNPKKKYYLLVAPMSAIIKFSKMYFLKLGFLDGRRGFLLASVSAFGSFLKYAKLWQEST